MQPNPCWLECNQGAHSKRQPTVEALDAQDKIPGARRHTSRRQFFCPALVMADEWNLSWSGSRLQPPKPPQKKRLQPVGSLSLRLLFGQVEDLFQPDLQYTGFLAGEQPPATMSNHHMQSTTATSCAAMACSSARRPELSRDVEWRGSENDRSAPDKASKKRALNVF